MDIKLGAILSRFPGYRELILKQIKENEEFESLCTDYDVCIHMLKALETDAALKHSKLEEYLEIKIGLEQEVLRHLG